MGENRAAFSPTVLAGGDHGRPINRAVRRHHHRSRVLRSLHAAPTACSRPAHPCDRSGLRCGWHMVVEPLSRCPLRHRILRLLLLVRSRSRAGLDLVGAVRHPAGDPLLCEPRRRSVRPAHRHQFRHPHARCRLAGVRLRLEDQHRHRSEPPRPVSHHGRRLSLTSQPTVHRGTRHLRRTHPAHRRMAP